jgi:chromosome segregation ATPase
MVFGLFKKKPAAPKKATDPLGVFDQVIASVERQGGEVRKSAATLLALRAELTRDQTRYLKRIDDIEERLRKAAGEEKAEKTLRNDVNEARRLLETTKEALAKAEGDAKLLMETAEGLGKQLTDLQEERQSARARLSAGVMVSEALQAQVASFDRLMKLDAARDEVEKAHALAELYREDADT